MDNPATWRDRAADISFVISSLEEIKKQLTGFEGELDRAKIGVGGHSFGAYTSMLIGGATVLVPGQEEPVSFADLRVRAILPIAGQGRGQQGLHDHSWDKLTLPMIMITGTQDRGLNGEEPRWRAEGFQFCPPGNKYWAFVTGASHFSYDGRTGNSAQNRISDVVKSASLAFWDAYLRESQAAKEYLTSRRLQEDHAGAVEMYTK
jgi:predicted dienelactone hydrolase